MKLNEYLSDNNLSAKQFALRLQDDVSEEAVRKWATGERIPRDSDQMRDIFRATRGLVTPNDFYGIGLALLPSPQGN